jgi:hypothetical protein
MLTKVINFCAPQLETEAPACLVFSVDGAALSWLSVLSLKALHLWSIIASYKKSMPLVI